MSRCNVGPISWRELGDEVDIHSAHTMPWCCRALYFLPTKMTMSWMGEPLYCRRVVVIADQQQCRFSFGGHVFVYIIGWLDQGSIAWCLTAMTMAAVAHCLVIRAGL